MKSTLGAASLMSLLLTTSVPAFANDEGDGRIQSRRGNPSPSVAESNINEYTFQDEQVNLGPDDQDILVLRSDEKVLLNRYVTKTFPLKNATPREIRNVFRELTGKEGGRAEVIRDKKKKENFLQVIVPKWQIPFINEAVPLLDEAWVQENNDGTEEAYYLAKHRDIEDVDRLAKRYAGEGFTEFDENNNAAIRRDEPYRVNKWLGAAEVLDIPEHQGSFHVKVYEVNVSDDLRLGLDYIAWKNGPGRNLFEIGLAGFDFDDRVRNVASIFTPVGQRDLTGTGSATERDFIHASRFGSFNFLLTAAYMDFLSTKGKAKTLAEGTVQVRSGSSGTFSATEQVLSFSVLPNDPGSSGFEPDRINDIEDDTKDAGDLSIFDRQLNRMVTGEVGLFIDISPVILLESMEVEILAEISNVEGYTPQGLPIINTSVISTKARMRDGSTLVLAGLTRTEKNESKQGAPFLSTIPVLGYLFGGENNINRQKQIIVVIEAETETQGESLLADAPMIQTISNMVVGQELPAIPENSFGFDMWMLGEGSGAQL